MTSYENKLRDDQIKPIEQHLQKIICNKHYPYLTHVENWAFTVRDQIRIFEFKRALKEIWEFPTPVALHAFGLGV